MTRKEREAAEAVEIEASIARTNAECDFEVGSRRPLVSHLDLTVPRYPRLSQWMSWYVRAPFSGDLASCTETNS